jgi:hypothetical protein
MPATASDPVTPSPVSHEVPSMLPDRRERQKRPRSPRAKKPAGPAEPAASELPATAAEADSEQGTSEEGHVNYLA